MDVEVKSHNYLRRIAENLLEFQRSGQFCDVVVQLAGVELGAHSAVLAATSPLLRQLLTVARDKDPRGSIIRLDGYDSDVALLWLEFVYTGRCFLGSKKQLADVRELCVAMRMPEPVCESSAPSCGLVGPDERERDSELNTDQTILVGNFDLPEAEEGDRCENSVESISLEGNPQAMFPHHKGSVNLPSASLEEERPLVAELVTLDRQNAVIPDSEKFDDDSHTPATHDTSDLKSSTDCDEAQHPCSLSQTVSASFPSVPPSNGVCLSEPTHPNFGESFPVIMSTESASRDSTATPLSTGCHGERCNVCGNPCIDDTCDGKAGGAQTALFRCMCLDREEVVVKLNQLDVKTRRKKAVQRTSRKRFHACRLCSRAYGTHSGLYGHLSRQHPAMMVNETHCGICQSSFRSAGDFLKHVIVFGGSNRNLKSSGRVHLRIFEGDVRDLAMDRISTRKRGRPKKNVPVVPEFSSFSQVQHGLKTHSLELKMGSHKCPVCLEVFWTHTSLYRHTAQHEFLHIARERRPTCGICQTSFDDVLQLVEHVTSKAGPSALQKDDKGAAALDEQKELAVVAAQQTFDCSHCDRSFESRSGLRSHINMHLNAWPHKCPSCGSDFRFAKHLSSHARIFHGVFVCSKCGVSCSCSPEELKASEAGSGGDPTSKTKALTCQDCRKVFQSRKGYLTHVRTHTGAKSFVCEFCGRAFNRKDRLTSHRSMHVSKAFPCAFCEKRFLSPARLREHARTHSGESPLVCSHCGLRFRTRNAIRVHIVRKHSALRGLKAASFKCDLCTRQFLSRTYLTMHLKWHGRRLRTVKCDVCGRGFYDVYGLRSHMAVHAGMRERPFLCYTCNKGFASRGNLQAHILSHKRDRSFVCEYCNEGFRFKGHLTEHHRKADCTNINAIIRTDGDIELVCEEIAVDG